MDEDLIDNDAQQHQGATLFAGFRNDNPPLTRVFNVNLNLNSSSQIPGDLARVGSTSGSSSNAKSKGKAQDNYAFIEGGLMTSQAMQILNEGWLIHISPVFNSPLPDLEKEVFPGVFAKDILEGAVLGSIDSSLTSISLSAPPLLSLVTSVVQPLTVLSTRC